MSSDTGDSTSRLSDALDELFSGSGSTDDTATEPSAAPAEPEPYVLPEIVPATAERAPADGGDRIEAPRLPDSGAGRSGVTDERPDSSRADDVTARVARPDTAQPPAAPTPGREPAAPRPAPVVPWPDRAPAPSGPSASQLRAPGRRPRVRRVTRVVRHVDPWSTFKVALLFNAVGYIVCLTSGVLLWRVADSTGTLDNVERWFTQFGWETFELDGSEVFHNAWIIGLFVAVAATGGAVLLVTLFNLVSDIVGGVRMTVLEEEVVERTISSTRRYVVRRPTDAAATGFVAAAHWSTDDLDEAPDDGSGRAVTDDAPGSAASPGTNGRSGDDDRRTHDEPAVDQSASATTDWSVD